MIVFVILLPVSQASAQDEELAIGEAVSVETTFGTEGPGLNFTGCTRVDVAVVNAAYEQEVVERVNQERWNNGQLPPLKRNPLLDLAARYHARDMRDGGYFAHDSYDGSAVVCSWSTRVNNWYSGWNSLAENIAAGYGSPSSVMSGWMGSDGHRANILSTSNWEIGVGYDSGGSWGNYWVQDFGRKGAVYPLVINREAGQTDAYQVSLYLYGAGTYTQMRLKNDNGEFGSWIPFSANVSWNLRQIKGTRAVTVELKKADGTTTTSSDEIYLTNGAELGGLPASVLFVYNQDTGRYLPGSISLNPQNLGGTLALSWTAGTPTGWIDLTQSGGVTPGGSTQVSIAGLNTSTPGLYSGSVTISVTDPTGTLNSPAQVAVQVSVVTDLDHRVFMPVVRR